MASDYHHGVRVLEINEGTRPIRTTPRMLMLYFTAGIPAFAQFRSIC